MGEQREQITVLKAFGYANRTVGLHYHLAPVVVIVAVGVSALAALVGGFQRDAIDHIVAVQFNLAQRQNLTVTFIEPTARQALFEIQRLPGVRRAGHRRYRTGILLTNHLGERLGVGPGDHPSQ